MVAIMRMGRSPGGPASTTTCSGRKPHQNLEGFDVNCAMSISVITQQTYLISNLISTKLFFEYTKFDHRKFKQYLENDKWTSIWIWIEFPLSYLIWIVFHLLKYINSKIILLNIFVSVHDMPFVILYVICYFPGTESIVTSCPLTYNFFSYSEILKTETLTFWSIL